MCVEDGLFPRLFNYLNLRRSESHECLSFSLPGRNAAYSVRRTHRGRYLISQTLSIINTFFLFQSVWRKTFRIWTKKWSKQLGGWLFFCRRFLEIFAGKLVILVIWFLSVILVIIILVPDIVDCTEWFSKIVIRLLKKFCVKI